MLVCCLRQFAVQNANTQTPYRQRQGVLEVAVLQWLA